MIYTLKHFDTPILNFSAESGAEPNIEILSVNDQARNLIPLDMEEISSAGLESWIRHRSIPKNRAYVDKILTSMGLSVNRPMDNSVYQRD